MSDIEFSVVLEPWAAPVFMFPVVLVTTLPFACIRSVSASSRLILLVMELWTAALLATEAAALGLVWALEPLLTYLACQEKRRVITRGV